LREAGARVARAALDHVRVQRLGARERGLLPCGWLGSKVGY
jgi:hypothetical protein